MRALGTSPRKDSTETPTKPTNPTDAAVAASPVTAGVHGAEIVATATASATAAVIVTTRSAAGVATKTLDENHPGIEMTAGATRTEIVGTNHGIDAAVVVHRRRDRALHVKHEIVATETVGVDQEIRREEIDGVTMIETPERLQENPAPQLSSPLSGLFHPRLDPNFLSRRKVVHQLDLAITDLVHQVARN